MQTRPIICIDYNSFEEAQNAEKRDDIDMTSNMGQTLVPGGHRSQGVTGTCHGQQPKGS